MIKRTQELDSIMDMLVKDFHDAVVAHYKYCLNQMGDTEEAKRKCALLIQAVGKMFFPTHVSAIEEELETMGILRKLEEKGIFDLEEEDNEFNEDEEVDDLVEHIMNDDPEEFEVHMVKLGSGKIVEILEKIFEEMEREEKENG